MRPPWLCAAAAAAQLLLAAPPVTAIGLRGNRSVAAPPLALVAGEGARADIENNGVPYGRCLRNTGRACQNQIADASVVDYMTQCYDSLAVPVGSTRVLEQAETCSAGGEWPQGYCVCSPGWCANAESHCTKYENEVLGPVRTITVKQFGDGPTAYVYMAPDGSVKVGSPPSPTAAQWQVARTKDGAYHLYTLAYPNDLLDAFDQCTVTEFFGHDKETCQSVVGHVPKPPASQTGWVISKWNEQFPRETYVTLRSLDTNRNLYFDGKTLSGRSCGDSSRPAECPGPYGALKFNPPLHGAAGITFQEPPMSGGWMLAQIFLYLFSGLLMCCLCIFNTRMDSKTDRFHGNLCGDICCLCCGRGRSY